MTKSDMLIFRVVCVALLCDIVAAELPNPLSDDFINLINSKNTTWTAERNFREDIPFTYIKNLMGALKDDGFNDLPEKRYPIDVISKLPENFDARNKWTNCPSLLEIRDQGPCASCWAVAAVEAMTDRVCIYSNGTKYFHFSTNDVLSCCENNCGFGCEKGYSRGAWMYWKEYGIVSGGEYNSEQGCKPYVIEPCDHRIRVERRPCNDVEFTPICEKYCEDNYIYDYCEDKHYGKTVYRLNGVDQISAEIYQNGPVEADFTVHSDFLHYKSGIYQLITGDEIGSHSVKIIGWGVEDGIEYWLIANSWNTEWGDNGFFKMLRGKNLCGIESHVIAGEPKL